MHCGKYKPCLCLYEVNPYLIKYESYFLLSCLVLSMVFAGVYVYWHLMKLAFKGMDYPPKNTVNKIHVVPDLSSVELKR